MRSSEHLYGSQLYKRFNQEANDFQMSYGLNCSKGVKPVDKAPRKIYSEEDLANALAPSLAKNATALNKVGIGQHLPQISPRAPQRLPAPLEDENGGVLQDENPDERSVQQMMHQAVMDTLEDAKQQRVKPASF